jgi:adenylate cyclase class IV
MPTNVEIKARVADVNSLICKAQELSTSKDVTEMNQEDTFFNVTNGRLKLREIKVNLHCLCISINYL